MGNGGGCCLPGDRAPLQPLLLLPIPSLSAHPHSSLGPTARWGVVRSSRSVWCWPWMKEWAIVSRLAEFQNSTIFDRDFGFHCSKFDKSLKIV
jgi:hypothetical protein